MRESLGYPKDHTAAGDTFLYIYGENYVGLVWVKKNHSLNGAVSDKQKSSFEAEKNQSCITRITLVAALELFLPIPLAQGHLISLYSVLWNFKLKSN